ncbi:t-SNARE [Mycena amicta]|nr:t-SNARE [Mycena amicta]
MSFQDTVAETHSNPSSSSAQSRESALSLSIFKIAANTHGIRTLVGQVGGERDSDMLRRQIRDLAEVTQVLADSASKSAKDLAGQSQPGPALKKILKDLETALREFKAVKKVAVERQRTFLDAPPAYTDEPQSPDASSPGRGEVQTQILASYASEDAYHDAEIVERRAAIGNIQQGVADIAYIMGAVATMVESQGEDVALIHTNIERTARQVEEGAGELARAARSQRRARRTCLKLIFGVVCAVVVFVILV